jgi:hypothetical protein
MRTPKRAPLIAAVFTFVALLFASTPEAQAQPRILRPSTRPMFFTGGVGTEFFGLNDGDFGPGRFGYNQRFKVALDFGYHFSGKGDGPAIGASLEQTFGNRFGYMLNPAFKFWWDIEIADMAIYIAPFAKAGYAMMTRPNICSRRFLGVRRCPMGHFANIGIGVEGRVVLNDRGMLFLRPVQIDTYLGPDDFYGEVFIIGYSLLLGGGVTF